LQCVAFVLVVFAVAACTPAAAQSTFTGVAQAKDGDSLMVGNREVRLFGIDAPEWSQTCKRGGRDWACGQEAANRLSKLVTGKRVLCLALGTDQHERTLAKCSVDGIEVNKVMVTSGYAIAYRHYSFAYVSAEQTAKAYKRGLWAGTFEMPSQYRHEEEVAPAAEERIVRTSSPPVVMRGVRSKPQPSGNCRIKGNRGRHGPIYHVPGQRYYNQTIAEQIFCTEGEARAAGYRRAKV